MTNTATWAIAATLVLSGLLVCLPAAPRHATTLMLIFPPWWSQARVWRAASGVGDIVDTTAAGFVLVLHSEQGDLARQAHRAGALLALEPQGLGACGLRARRSA